MLCYFDNNATTRVAPEVCEAMQPFLGERCGNPSSAYGLGREAASQVRQAREKVAALLNANPEEIVFTSCGTESINSAIHSALSLHPDKQHIVTTAVEHPATLNFCAWLKRQGWAVTVLPVDGQGALNSAALEDSIRPDTALVSVMLANNETGLLFPVPEVSSVCRRKGVLCHSDAVQAAGKLPLDVRALSVDFLSLSAHKLHGPKGIGLLYIRQGLSFQPYLLGGHQESGRRAGTENVASIVGFGQAAELALARLAEQQTRVRALRDRLEKDIMAAVPLTSRNGAAEPRLPNTTNLTFAGVDSEAVLLMLDQVGVCASSGSACATGASSPSHVLTAMGFSPERARSSLRFSLGFYNTDQEVDYLLAHLPGFITKLRAISAL
jgi:cysteine desulfurase